MSYTDEELIKGILGGPTEEDEKYARGMGALTAGLQMFRNPRDIAGGALLGLGTYNNTLGDISKTNKEKMQTALSAKKLVQDNLKYRGYSDYFSDKGVDTLGLAKAAAVNGDGPTLAQALSMHAKEKDKDKFIPQVKGYMLQNGQAVKIPGLPDDIGDDVKPTNKEREIEELIKANPNMTRWQAEGVVYGHVQPLTSPDGSTYYVDRRYYMGLQPPQNSEPGTSIPPPGTASAPVPGPAGPAGVSGASVGASPRFSPTPTPIGGVPVFQGIKPQKELDTAVDAYSRSYEKTNIDQMRGLFDDLDKELAEYGYHYDPKAEDYVPIPGVKPKDVPGMGLTGGAWPIQALSEKGRAVAGVVQSIVNQKLYDLSGKAVTANEMMRQLKAMQATAFLGDRDTLRGLARVRKGYETSAAEILGGAKPEVRAEYERRRESYKPQKSTGEITVDEMGYEIGPDGKKTGRRFDLKTGERML